MDRILWHYSQPHSQAIVRQSATQTLSKFMYSELTKLPACIYCLGWVGIRSIWNLMKSELYGLESLLALSCSKADGLWISPGGGATKTRAPPLVNAPSPGRREEEEGLGEGRAEAASHWMAGPHCQSACYTTKLQTDEGRTVNHWLVLGHQEIFTVFCRICLWLINLGENCQNLTKMEIAPNGLLDTGSLGGKKSSDERTGLHVMDQGKIKENSHLIWGTWAHFPTD